jgi:hypothetical protein
MTQRDTFVKGMIRDLLSKVPDFSVRDLAERTGRTRQALNAHLRRALAAGELMREGSGRSTRYRLPAGATFEARRAAHGLREEDLWREFRAYLGWHLPERGEAADAILGYVVTELVNNAIDHSQAREIILRGAISGARVRIEVEDAGIGAFESVRARLGFASHLHALQHLSKGKVTTDPERHTGEGLFFSSKAVDTFELTANGLTWAVDSLQDDQAVLEETRAPGTRATCWLETPTTRSLQELFERFTTDLAFDRSRTVVRLFEHGTRFVSRSEAKRLSEGLERFREVELDFHGVGGVGQGFVDELLRVWANAHPRTRLLPVRMNDAVAFMVHRGLASGN